METENQNKMPTTLSVDSQIKDSVIPQLEDRPFFQGMQNMDLLVYAMARGFHGQMELELKKRNDGGYVRTEQLKDGSPAKALAYSALFSKSDFKEPETLLNARELCLLMERYANGGFQLLDGDLQQGMTDDEMANRCIADMDELYEEYFGQQVE